MRERRVVAVGVRAIVVRRVRRGALLGEDGFGDFAQHDPRPRIDAARVRARERPAALERFLERGGRAVHGDGLIEEHRLGCFGALGAVADPHRGDRGLTRVGELVGVAQHFVAAQRHVRHRVSAAG